MMVQSNPYSVTWNLCSLPVFLDSTYNFMGPTKTSVSKAIPQQAWTGPEGSRRLTHPDFKKIGT